MIFSLGLINLLEQLTELRETLTYIYHFIKVYDKRYKLTARWRDRQGKVPNKGASVLQELGAQFSGMWKHSGSPNMEALKKKKA